jgi:hypothetical protein
MYLMEGICSYFTLPSASKRRSTCYWEAAFEADHPPASPLPAETVADRKLEGSIWRHIAPQNQDNMLWGHEGQSEPVSGVACHVVQCMCACQPRCCFQSVELSAEPDASTVIHIAAPVPAVNAGLFVQWTEEQELPFDQRCMLLCEFQEDNSGNTALLLVIADSEMLRRATVLAGQHPHCPCG